MDTKNRKKCIIQLISDERAAEDSPVVLQRRQGRRADRLHGASARHLPTKRGTTSRQTRSGSKKSRLRSRSVGGQGKFADGIYRFYPQAQSHP